ncbi:MAG TPA: alkaline phosphatase PhoX, partial [Marinagarivorans sp.]
MSKATFDETRYNDTTAPDFQDVLRRSLKRRSVLKSGSALAALSMMGGLAGCSDDNDDDNDQKAPKLGFNSIEGSKTDAVVVADNYKAQVLAPWGTPLNDNAAEWKDDGTNTPTDALNSVGMHHDGMHFFPLNGDTDGLLCINHEYIDQNALHPDGATSTQVMVDGVAIDVRPVDEVLKEIYAHGVTVVRIVKTDGVWEVVKNDPHNKRYTGATEFDLAGPVAGSTLVQTKFSPNGMTARGTLNNCGNGYTPWGTYLTCEENWPGYFTNNGERTEDQIRIGLSTGGTRYGWETPAGDAAERNDEFARFNVTPSADSHLMDYRNEASGHGYIVEIDPYSPNANAVKRTALGRFRIEGCVTGKIEAGKPLVFYSRHDA